MGDPLALDGRFSNGLFGEAVSRPNGQAEPPGKPGDNYHFPTISPGGPGRLQRRLAGAPPHRADPHPTAHQAAKRRHAPTATPFHRQAG
jgi:hypothetical protein